MTEEAKVVEVEVVKEPPPAARPLSGRSRRAFDGAPPIHPLSALLLVVVDNFWLLPEWAVVTWSVTVPLAFASVFLLTFGIQKFVKKDPARRAFLYSTVLGLLAAIPTSITGTPVGLALLAWTGLNRLFPKTFPGTPK